MAKNRWHVWGFLMRCLVFVPFIGNTPITDILLAGTICVVMFELLINKIALNVSWFYVGSTAKFDLILKKNKWLLMFTCLFIAIILKIFI